MNKIRLVTVTGSRVDTLWHMLNHYKDLVDEISATIILQSYLSQIK